MPNLSIRNLARIRQISPEIAEALSDLQNAHNNVAQQVNASPVGVTPPPLPHQAISVVGGAGVVDVALTDNAAQFRGKENHFDYSADGWKTFHTKSIGPSNNWRGYLGKGTYQIRSYTDFPTSAPSDMIYHPPVDASGDAEPAMQAGQGSGTSGAGYGQLPYTGAVPPKRA